LDELVARIGTIRDEFECYGYRRVGAALRHQGVVVTARSCAASCASTAYSQGDAAILDTWSRSVVG
jgi:hypothetical protein